MSGLSNDATLSSLVVALWCMWLVAVEDSVLLRDLAYRVCKRNKMFSSLQSIVEEKGANNNM